MSKRYDFQYFVLYALFNLEPMKQFGYRSDVSAYKSSVVDGAS